MFFLLLNNNSTKWFANSLTLKCIWVVSSFWQLWIVLLYSFELWCWRRLLRVSWTSRRSNQSTLKEMNPEDPMEGLMLKLKPQYFGHLMWRADTLEKTLMLGKTEDRRRRGQQRMRWLMASLTQWRWASSRSWCCSPWGHKESDRTEQLNWWFNCSQLRGAWCWLHKYIP